MRKTHESALFLRKMTENDEKNDKKVCRMYIKYVESMYIIYKNKHVECNKKYTKREIILHYCAK